MRIELFHDQFLKNDYLKSLVAKPLRNIPENSNSLLNSLLDQKQSENLNVSLKGESLLQTDELDQDYQGFVKSVFLNERLGYVKVCPCVLRGNKVLKKNSKTLLFQLKLLKFLK